MRRAPRDRRVTLALGAAAACGIGLVGVGLAALRVDAGHDLDVATLHGFAGFYRSWLDSEIELTGRLADPVPYAAVGLACIGVALARRRALRAAAVGVVLLGTGLTTQLLKHALAEQRYADWLGFAQVDPASLPSGHATAALTLVLCAVMVAPPSWRVAVGLLGAAGSVAVAYATLALAWHYPSDVIAGFLVAGLWVSLALAVLQRVEMADPEPARPAGLAWLLTLGTLGVIGAAAVAAVASQDVPVTAGDRQTAVAGAAAIAALALALVGTTVIASSGPFPRARPAASPGRQPPPTATGEDDTTLLAGRGREAPADRPGRRSPVRGSSPRAR
jgi:membrane-associated phospholipid phosphatase